MLGPGNRRAYLKLHRQKQDLNSLPLPLPHQVLPSSLTLLLGNRGCISSRAHLDGGKINESFYLSILLGTCQEPGM